MCLVLATCVWPVGAQEPSGRVRTGARTTSASGRTGSRLIDRTPKSQVRPASAMQMEGEVVQAAPLEEAVMPDEHVVHDGHVHEGHVIHDGGATCDGSCGGGCETCVGESYCDTCHSPRRFCLCLPSHGWVHAEYLLWWQSGMNLPPLVTTSPTGTARAAAGILPGASILYGGDNNVLDGSRSGGRIRFGTWFDRFPGLGLEGEYFGLAQGSEEFFQNSNGTPILARPFFNVVSGLQDAELVAFPNVLSGSVQVDVTSELNGAAARFRRSLWCSNGCAYSRFCCTTVPTSSRMDGTLGYRFYELKESLAIRERLQSTDPNNPGSFNILDRFDTRNQFNGGEIGVLWQGRRGMWSLDGLMRVGIGNTHQTVTIAGDTIVTQNGVNTTFNNGILAQRTNIGTYDRNEFTMIPELGLTLGYQFTRCVRLTAGYSLIYWGNVVRPGDQVDLDVNPNLFPPEAVPFTGPLRPQFQFVSTDYWVQGLSFGAEMRW